MNKIFGIKQISLLFTFTILILTAVACGGNNGSQEDIGSSSSSKEGQNEEQTSNAENQSLLEKIKEENVIEIGIMGTYPPYNFMNEDHEIVGFDAGIARGVAKRIGVKVHFVKTPWSGMLPGLQNGKFDAVVSQVTITPERQKILDFSQPYITNTVNIIVNQDNDSIHSLKDFKGKTIGIGLGTNDEAYLRNVVRPKVGDFTIKTYNDVITTLMDLETKRIDATINNKFAIKPIVEKKDIHIKAVGEPVKQDKAGIAIRPDHPEFLKAINNALTDMKKDGTYEKIYVKWFDEKPKQK